MRVVNWTASVDKEKCKASCQKTCPAGVKVPVYIDLIKSNRFQEAYEVIQADNPFPSVCGRVCHSPCENECRRGKQDAALAIRALKRFAGDQLINGGLPVPRVKENKGIRVAIIGAGPAGLSAAYFLTLKGYQITIFEALEVAGGMMVAGIPEYRLPKDVLNKEIDVIKNMGVEIKTGVKIGKDITLEQILRNGYKAIFLAVGARKDQPLNIPGEELEGVLTGVRFLHDVNLGNPPDFSGKDAAVIGGGNVAADAARSALRLGANSVTVYYRRTKKEMPAIEGEIAEMQHEGVKIHVLTAPVEILGNNGKVNGLKLTKMMLGKPDKTGRPLPVPIDGSEFTVKADVVISAIGYNPDAADIDPALKTNGWGGIVVDADTMVTSIPSVFSGGDCVTGAATLIEAVSAGKKGASSIDKYLGGDGIVVKDLNPPRNFGKIIDGDTKRVRVPTLGKVEGFKETELGYTLEQAINEAARCLQCDVECRTCEKVCPVLAIKGKTSGQRNVAEVDVNYCVGCNACEQRCPEYAILLNKLDKPVIIKTDVNKVDYEQIASLCRKAKFHPEQIVCYCTATRAEEIAAAVILGAKTPEDVSRATGVRTGCKVECIQPVLRILEAAGIQPEPRKDGWQWYGRTPTVWEIREGIKAKFNHKGFYFTEDIQLLDRLIENKKDN
ncbi:MAG: NAD(P)-binding protein [Bacillota bacterium]